VPLASIMAVRQGTVSLTVAARASADFVFRHTLAGSRREFVRLFDWTPLAERVDLASGVWLLSAVSGGGLRIYDEAGATILEFEVALEDGYRSRGGVELPTAGLRVTRIGTEKLGEPVRVRSLTRRAEVVSQ
jgi:hypothetical protein